VQIVLVNDRLLRLDLVDVRAHAVHVHLHGDLVALDQLAEGLCRDPLQAQLLLVGLKVTPKLFLDHQ